MSTPFLQVPYLVKFDRIHGILIISKSSLGLTMDEEFIRSMIDAKNHQAMVPKKTPEQIDHEAPEISFEMLKGKILRPSSIITLKENDEHPIAKPALPGFSADLRYLSYIDDLSFEAVVYELIEPEARLISAVGPGPEEDKMFLGPGIGDTLFMFFKQMNIINPMFFSNVIVNDTLIISASLPKIYWENREAEHIACFNQQAYLYKNIESGKVERVLTLPAAPDTTLVASHTTTFFSNNGKLMFLSVSKGWPVSGSESLNWNNTRENPFLESFYDNAPLLAIYDIHGNFIRYFGSLTSFEIQNRLGYTLATPLIRQSDDVYWIVNTHSGDMRGYTNIYEDQPEYSIKLYEVKSPENPPDPEKAPLDYIKFQVDHLQKTTLDIFADDQIIWHILKDGDMIFLQELDFDGKILDQWLFPNVYEDMEGTTFRLFRKDGKVIVKGIFESPEKTCVLEFSPEYTSSLE